MPAPLPRKPQADPRRSTSARERSEVPRWASIATVTVSADGTRIMFLRSGDGQDPVNCLWVVDAATGDGASSPIPAS